MPPHKHTQTAARAHTHTYQTPSQPPNQAKNVDNQFARAARRRRHPPDRVYYMRRSRERARVCDHKKCAIAVASRPATAETYIYIFQIVGTSDLLRSQNISHAREQQHTYTHTNRTQLYAIFARTRATSRRHPASSARIARKSQHS